MANGIALVKDEEYEAAIDVLGPAYKKLQNDKAAQNKLRTLLDAC